MVPFHLGTSHLRSSVSVFTCGDLNNVEEDSELGSVDVYEYDITSSFQFQLQVPPVQKPDARTPVCVPVF